MQKRNYLDRYFFTAYFLLIIILTTSPVYPQSEAEIEEIKQIIDLAFNYNDKTADTILSGKTEKSPDDLRLCLEYMMLTSIKEMRFRFESTRARRKQVTDSLDNLMLSRAERVIDLYDSDTPDLAEKFYLGGIKGYIAKIHGLRREWYSAFSEGKSGLNLYKEILQEDSTFYDVKLLLGMSSYYGARVSGFAGFITALLGMGGDRDEGAALIGEAFEKGRIINSQAALLFAQIYSRVEDRPSKTLPYFAYLLNKYPNNDYLLNWYVYECLEADRLDKARAVVESEDADRLRDYALARYYHLTGDYLKSQFYIGKFQKNKKFHYRRFEKDIIKLAAVNNLILGKNAADSISADALTEEAREQIEILNGVKSSLPDIFNLRRLIYLNEAPDKINNLIEKYKSARLTKPLYGIVQYLLGVYYFRSDKYKYSEAAFLSSVKYSPEITKYRSVRYLMRIYERENSPAENVEYLLGIIQDSDYDNLEFALSYLKKKYDL